MSVYSDDAQNLLFEPVVSFVDTQDGSLKFINPKLMSSNFDGHIYSKTASMAVASMNAGYMFGIYEDDISDYAYYPIIKLYKDDEDSPTYTGYHEVLYIKNNVVETASFGAASCVVVVSEEIWDEKDIGTSGWMMTQGGNAIFSNVAIRGDLEATTLDVGGENGIVYDGTSITIGTDVTILGTTTTESLQVGTSPNILKISASPNGVVGEDGIYINEYNYWYTTGSFGVGGAGGSAKWNGSTLSLTGNINATSGSFTGALTASVGTIGGFTLSNESLTASTSTASTAVGISTGASAIFAGGIDTSGSTGAAFWVSRTGSVFANSASINGRIVATSGSFSGDITASSGKFVGNVGVTDGGKIYAGSNPDSGQRIFISSAGLYGYGISGVEAFALPTDGASPRIGKFSIISTGIVSQSAENANMIYGNVDGSGNVTDGIVIRGYRTSGASAAIYTVIGGNATTYDTNNGFYLEESGKFKLKGTSGSLIFDGNNLSITGTVYATSGSFTGSVNAQYIQADTGSVGGFILSASSITGSAGGSNYVGITKGASAFFAGATDTIGSGNAQFWVSNTGSVFATAASISGRISAASGTIGGFTLSGTSLTASTSTASTAVGVTTTASAFFAGALSTTGSTGAAFWVSRDGQLFSTSASITGNINATTISSSAGSVGGFVLSASSLTASAGTSSAVGITTGSISFFAGATDRNGTNAVFLVNSNGALTATSASISGRISAASGTIGGFTLAGTSLTAGTSGSIVGLSTTASSFFAGATSSVGAGAKFWVSRTGSVFARAGYIGTVDDGFSINDTSISSTDTIAGGYTYTSNTLISPLKSLITDNIIKGKLSWTVGGQSYSSESGIGFRTDSSNFLYPRLNTQLETVGVSTQALTIWGQAPSDKGGQYLSLKPCIVIDDETGGIAGIIGAYKTDQYGLETYSGKSWIDINDAGNTQNFIEIMSGSSIGTWFGMVIDGKRKIVKLGQYFDDGIITNTGGIKLGINDNSPSYELDVNGEARFVGRTRVGAADFSVNTNTLYVDAGNTRVGVLNSTPDKALSVSGTVKASNGFMTGTIGSGDIPIISSTGFITSASTDSATTPAYSWINNTSMGMYRIAANQFGFATNGVSRFEISNASVISIQDLYASGDFIIGARDSTATSSADGCYFPANAGGAVNLRRKTGTATNPVLNINKHNGTTALTGSPQRMVSFYISTNEVGRILVDSAGTITPAFTTASDYRLKEDIKDFNYASEIIKKTQLRSYKWKKTGQHSVGFIAHELQEASKDLVDGKKDDVDEYGNPAYQHIAEGRLIPYLTGALKEALLDIEKLYDRISHLETKIQELENSNE